MSDVTVDASEAEALFRELAELSGKSAGVLLRERAGLLGRVLAERTVPFQPIGDYAGQRETGVKKVEAGVASVYVSGAKVFEEIKRKIGERAAKAWLKLLKTDPAKADALMQQAGLQASNLKIMAFDGGAAHRAAMPIIARRGRNNRPPLVIADTKSLNAYRRKQSAHVGWAKRGWIAAARQIPGAKGFSRLPAWMKRDGAPGLGIDETRKTDNPSVTLNNRVPYISKLLIPKRQAQAFRAFEGILVKDLRQQINHLKQKHHA